MKRKQFLLNLATLGALPVIGTANSFANISSGKRTNSMEQQQNSIQLIRNATLVIQYAGKKILVDPMLSAKGTNDPLAGIARNPTIELPTSIDKIINGIDLVLVTHTHRDHFDQAAAEQLNKSIKLINQPADKEYFQKANFTNAETVEEHTSWNGIQIYRTGGQHGSGEILTRMGNVSGYVLKAENQPTIYIVGDSIWNDEVGAAIEKHQPDIIVTNSGGAIIPRFETTPILMDEAGTITLIKAAPKAKVIAVHMESLDHCRTTRASLRAKAEEAGISNAHLLIPDDGDVVHLV